VLNVLNEVEAQGQADIHYSVKKKLIMLVKPIIVQDDEN
jgi:hypothetical protein